MLGTKGNSDSHNDTKVKKRNFDKGSNESIIESSNLKIYDDSENISNVASATTDAIVNDPDCSGVTIADNGVPVETSSEMANEADNENSSQSQNNHEDGKLKLKKAKKKCGVIHVEAIIEPVCPTPLNSLRSEVERYVSSIGQTSYMYICEELNMMEAPSSLRASCIKISIVDIDNGETAMVADGVDDDMDCIQSSIASWDVSTINVQVFSLSEEDAELEELDDDNDEDLVACETLPLPHSSLHDAWQNLILPRNIKQNLLEYAQSALLFTNYKVSSHIVSWNRVILLHGPPGTGKTTLCKALAHKLTIRMSHIYTAGGYLLEIHAHSLFSKWFSESGKLVNKLFTRIREMVEDEPDALFCVLVDEVESLAASRASSTSSSGEPSDAVRAVNSLLTSIDRLRIYNNVIVTTTTNITGSVDVAFVDRADIKQYIGLPTKQARYEILRSCVNELIRVGIITNLDETKCVYFNEENKNKVILPYRDFMTKKRNTATAHSKQTNFGDDPDCPENLLLECATQSEGLSGRSLRKIPFQSHAMFVRSTTVSLNRFILALIQGIRIELEARKKL